MTTRPAELSKNLGELKPSHPIRGEGELLPCPFCGSEAAFVREADEDGSFVAVECTGCGCGSGKHYPIMESADPNAANEWNRRAHPPTIYGKGESIDLMTVKAAFLWGYAKGSGGGLSAGEDEWSVYAQALQSIGGRTE